MARNIIWEEPHQINRVKNPTTGEKGFTVYTHEDQTYTVVWCQSATVTRVGIHDVDEDIGEVKVTERKKRISFF